MRARFGSKNESYMRVTGISPINSGLTQPLNYVVRQGVGPSALGRMSFLIGDLWITS